MAKTYIEFDSRIGVKADSGSRLKSELIALRSSSDNQPLWNIIQHMAYTLSDEKNGLPFLAKKIKNNQPSIIVTCHVRGYKPDYKSIDDVMSSLTDEEKQKIGNSVDPSILRTYIKGLFWGRDKISENEWIYRHEILTGGNYVTSSRHMFAINGNYSYAVDIRTTGGSSPMYTTDEASLLAAEVQKFADKKGYSTKVINHAILGDGNHMHIEVNPGPSVLEGFQNVINKTCGYDKPINLKPLISAKKMTESSGAPDQNTSSDKDDDNVIVQADRLENIPEDIHRDLAQDISDNRSLLPSDIGLDGLMDVLRIGDVEFLVCPVQQISYSQTSQFMRFSALRTTSDPKIATTTAPSNFTVSIIFPNIHAINTDLRSLVAQFLMTPVTVVQSRFMARMINSFYADHKDRGIENEFKSPEDESIWMVMTDMNLHSVPGFPETVEAAITLEYFEDRAFGDHLRFLKGKEDVAIKYDKKLFINGSRLPLPSEKFRIQQAELYKTRTNIKVTNDPAESALYKMYYKLAFKETGHPAGILEEFVPHQDGEIVATFNDMGLDRDKVREVERTLDSQFDSSLIQVAKMMDAGGQELEDFISGRLGITQINRDFLHKVGRNVAIGALDLMREAIKGTNLRQNIQIIKHGSLPLIATLSEDLKRAVLNLGEIGPELGYSDSDVHLSSELMKTVITLIGTMNLVGDAPSSFFNIGKLHNAADFAQYFGQDKIRELEILFGSSIAGFDIGKNVPAVVLPAGTLTSENFTQEKFDALSMQERLRRMKLAFTALLNSYLGIIEEGADKSDLTRKLNQASALFNNATARVEREFKLADGVKSILTGVSFTIHNKIVPMPVLGWSKPFFQHLGRSDWTINMNIVSIGDEYLKTIMYVINKTAHLSKQIQLNAPAKFIDLDATIELKEPKGIFKVLGIKKMLISAIEVSSIPENPNTYQLSLTLEEAELAIRKMENLHDEKFKAISQSTKNTALQLVAPLLKSIIIRKDHPYYGRMLDYNRIKQVMENPSYKEMWEILGISDMDYMDKYNVSKVLTFTKLNDQLVDPENFKKMMFPFQGERVIGLFKYDIDKSSENSIIRLIDSEINGDLILGIKQPITHPGLISALDDYHSNIVSIARGRIEEIKDKTEAFNTGIETFGSVGAAGAVGLIVANFWNPFFITAATTIAIIAGILWMINKLDEGEDVVASMALSTAGTVAFYKITSIIREMIIDDEILNTFPAELVVGVNQNLNDVINKLRLEIEESISGCYKDFEFNRVGGDIFGLPLHILDPSFYLHTNDLITGDLVRENLSDLNHALDMLSSRAIITAIQTGQMIKEAKTRGEKMPTETSENETDITKRTFINDGDIKWVESINDKIKDNIKQMVVNTNDKNIQSVADLFNKTDLQQKILGDVATEEAFLRLIYIGEAFKFDILKTGLMTSLERMAVGQSAIKEKGTPAGNAEQLKDFFDNWFQKIMDAGGIDIPINGKETLGERFLKEKKISINQYYDKQSGMQQLVQQTDRLARLYIAYKKSDREVAARRLAQYAALRSDPRSLEKRGQEAKTLVDMMWRGTLDNQFSDTAKIFPTYKVYLIEEDIPEWGIFHDFYDYSVIQDITVVKDRMSASDICTIKLSNIAGKLTDTFADNLPEIGTENIIPLTSVMLKPGTSVLVKMGYSNSQVELPVVFYGVITEVNPGPVVDIICQGYGAELTDLIAPVEGVRHGAKGDVKGLGDVITWVLQHTPGLSHFGKIGYLDLGKKDLLRESGLLFSGNQGKSRIASWLTGIPGLRFNDPRDDNVYLPYNTSNVLPDNSVTANPLTWLNWLKASYSNITFDWYLRDISAWDAIEEVTWFNPDTIHTVLPYNDNCFPFVPNIRNTLYVGPRKGFYKYTDYYSLRGLATNIEEVKRSISDFAAIADKITKSRTAFIAGRSRTGQTQEQINSASVNSMDELVEYLFNPSDRSGPEMIKALLGAVVDISPSSRENSTNTSSLLSSSEGNRLGVASTIYSLYNSKYTNGKGSATRDILEDATTFFAGEFGIASLKLNLNGNSHQYKKVQQHYIATSHSNIIQNSIVATSTGWANQVRLLTPENPLNVKNLSEIPVKERGNLLVDTFSLDDDIIADQLRTKEVFANNIDPFLWDDVTFAEKALNADTPWQSANSTSITIDGQNGPRVLNAEEAKKEKIKRLGDRQASWNFLPSRWRVGVSILAKEARNMYDGELTIVGNPQIKPYDVIHVLDYTNGMQGAVEVGRVIHNLNVETGLTTRIKPDLIVNQKEKFNEQDIWYMGRLFNHSIMRRYQSFGSDLFATGAFFGGKSLLIDSMLGGFFANIPAAASAVGVLSTIGFFAGVGLSAYLGYKSFKYHAERTISILGSTLGRDCLEIMPLTYKGMPYVAGIEGYRKDGPIRHMYSTMLDQNGNASVIERFGYANAPYEMAFYEDVLKDTPAWAAMKTLIGFRGDEAAIRLPQSIPDTRKAFSLVGDLF